MEKINTILTLNLQLFANHVNVTTDTYVNPDGHYHDDKNDLSAEMKTFYDMSLIVEAGPQLVHDQFAVKKPIPKNGGKVIEFRKFTTLPKATVPLTEGVTPAGKRLDVTTVVAEVSQYGDYITQSDVLELTALDNTIVEATKILGKQAGLTLGTVTRNALHTGTNVFFCPNIDASTGAETEVLERGDLDETSKLTLDVIQQAVTKMRTNNVPTINGDYVCIIHPQAMYDLMRDPEWVDVHKYAQPDEIYEGELGKICDTRFVRTSEAKIYGPAEISDGFNKLTVKTAISSSNTSVEVNEILTAGTYSGDDAIPVFIDGVENTIVAIANNTTYSTLTVGTAITSLAVGDLVCGKGGNSEGLAVYGSLLIGEGAYGVTEIEGGGLRTIIKQKGSAGTADPLDQRSSVGWKAIKTAEILIPEYILRIESMSPRFSKSAVEN